MISPRRPSGCWRGDPMRWVSRIPVSYFDSLVAVAMFFACQLLICALHRVGELLNDFPATILAMLLVALVMLGMSWKIGKGVDEFYERRLRGPTDLLNRHMSIGFTVPFMMIIKSPAASARDIGLIIACFILTGVLNSGLVYIMAHCLQRLAWAMVGVPPKQALAPSAALPERNVPPIVVEPPGSPAPRRSVTADERFRKCLSNASTLTNTPAGPSPILRPSEPETHNATPPLPPLPEPTPPTPTTRTRTKALDVLISNPVLYLSILAIPMIGLPIAVTTGNTAPIDTIVLFLLWTTFLATQRKSRSTPVLASHPRWRTFLSAALNAVLWTALGMIAYCALKSALSHHPSASLIDTLTSLSTGTTLSDLIIGSSTRPSMGAGDVAVSILNAGIVSWGLKLFECRAQLTSPSGVTTVVTASAAAALNVVCGPLLARALGLRLPGWCLAFAARSVTLALAGPAMGSLGGDVGVNAAMVVFSGIVFQVGLGLGVGGWLRGVFAATTRAWATGRGSDGGGGGRKVRDVEKGAAARPPTAATAGGDDGRLRDDEHQGDEEEEEEKDADSPLTVATGVMVGVNGAAMGTAHLYDADSRAAPYAALSMTVFGVMTVVMTSSDRLVHWLVAQVAS